MVRKGFGLNRLAVIEQGHVGTYNVDGPTEPVALRTLIETYLRRGGFEIQVNVVDKETQAKIDVVKQRRVLATLEAALGSGARMVLLTDLHNPTGAHLADPEMEALRAVARRHGARIVLDGLGEVPEDVAALWDTYNRLARRVTATALLEENPEAVKAGGENLAAHLAEISNPNVVFVSGRSGRSSECGKFSADHTVINIYHVSADGSNVVFNFGIGHPF